MANLEELLKEVSKIVVREKTQQEERRKRGENFNIFKVLGLSTSEVRLHSAFLAELLNPNGDHGLDDNFLKAFVDGVIRKQRESFAFDCTSAQVYVEYPVGTVSNEYDKGGRIDILIQDKNNQTIVIENKIYAGDQPLQMYRYNRYLTEDAKLEPSQYVLLYLSLEEGDLPSEESTGKNPIFDFYCINYQNDIICWLNECIGKAALYPAVREVINQYETNLKQILNIMSEINKNELMELLKKNLSATVNILELESEIRKEVRREFINKVLAKIANNNGFTIEDEIEDFVNMHHDAVISFNYKEKTDCFPFHGNFVLRWYGSNSNSIYYGIMMPAIEEPIIVDAIWPETNDKYFPYGFCWLANSGNNCHWDRNSAIVQMQKEIEMYESLHPERAIIAQEIDNQLKLIKNKLHL